MIDEERFLEITAKALSDTLPLEMNLTIKDAWLVMSTLQLATRHPDVSAMQRAMFRELAKVYEAALVMRHPEAKPLIDMGWDERFDVDKHDEPDRNALPTPLKPVNNCWSIYTEGATEDMPAMAQIGRPQDWGDPRWMYRTYTLEAQGYRNTVHCWLDHQVNEHEHLETFAPLVATIMLPGWPVERSGRDFMDEDDFWSAEWGEMPPYADLDEEY